MSELRDLLARADATPEAIAAAAAGMMRHYDRSPAVAVDAWRDALQAARPAALLPLLYVANEVLQNSKRNRGTKFCEAMSPVLGPALQYICQRDRTLTEKVRRTVKIWGDRHVYSVRFINELIEGLAAYRGDGTAPSPRPRVAPVRPPPTNSKPPAVDEEDDDDDPMKTAGVRSDFGSHDDDGDDSREDDDAFGHHEESEEPKLALDINLNLPATFQQNPTSSESPRATTKRRRGSGPGAGPDGKRAAALSTSGLLETFNRLSALQQAFERAQAALAQVDRAMEAEDASALASLVGDELQKAFRDNTQHQQQIQQQRRLLHGIAQEIHHLEQEALRYLPWLEAATKQDDDAFDFCDRLEQKIVSFQKIQAQIRKARDARREEERLRKEKEEREARARRDQEEAERFRQAALQRQTEETPGSVWNPQTREYQVLQTDESWRDH